MDPNFVGFMTDATPIPTATNALVPGTMIGEQYQVVKQLGEGAMGAVLLVQDRTLDRYVALKVLKPEVAERIESDARFRREARMLSRLTHPNVVTIYSFGSTKDAMAYIAMEYVEGHTLDAHVYEDTRFDPEVLCHVVEQICHALAEAHGRGVVHRDIKPGNVLLTSVSGDAHFVKVVDFGIAKVLEKGTDAESLAGTTQDGMIMGTPAYMAPEQALAQTVDARTDIYSMGVVACQLLTGRLPFQADSLLDMLAAHCSEPPMLPSALAPQFGFAPDGALDRVIDRALEKRNSDRYQSIDEFGRAFVEAAEAWQGRPMLVRPGTTSQSDLPRISAEPISGIEATFMDLEAPGPGALAGPSAPQVAVLVLELDSVWDDRHDAPVAEVVDCLAVVAAKVRQCVEDHGGQAVHGLSDRHVAVFRSPLDDQPATEAAVQAGLAVGASLAAMATDPTIPGAFRPVFRLSIDAGEILQGTTDDGSPILFGDVMVRARTLARASEPGHLVLSQRAYRRVRGLFECEPFEGSGGQTGQTVIAKQPIFCARESEIHGVPMDLVGRSAELDTLGAAAQRLFDSARVGAALITGAAGMGKTRLAWELLKGVEERSEPFWLEAGRCTEGGHHVPYEPFREALRARMRVAEDDNHEAIRLKADQFVRGFLARDPTQLTEDDVVLVAFLEELLGTSEGPAADSGARVHGEGAQRALLFERFAHLYQRMSDLDPVLFFLDDFQWASGPTRDLLGYLVGHLKDRHVLFVVAARSEGHDAAALALRREHIDLEEVALEPLSKDDTEELVRHALRRLVEVPANLVRSVCDLAQGVPLIVEETLHDLIDEGVIAVEGARWALGARTEGPLALPDTVEQLFAGRIARLPPHLRGALEVAAVAGERFWLALLRDSGGKNLDEVALAELEQRGFIRAQREVFIDGAADYVFVQNAMREAVYGSVDRARRKALHLEIAAWLEPHAHGHATRFDGVIGHHFQVGGEPARALPYLGRAAKSAMRMYALEEAVGHLESCHAMLPEIPHHEMDAATRHQTALAVLADLVRLRVLTGGLQQALDVAIQADWYAGDDVGEARNHRAIVSVWTGWALMRLGRYSEARAAFRQVAQVLRSAPDASLMLQAATGEAATTDKLGDGPTAVALIERAIEGYRGSTSSGGPGDVHLSAAFRILGNCQTILGHYDGAREAFAISYELAEYANAPEMLVDVLNGQAALHYYQSDVAAAEDTWRRALAIADEWDLIEHRAVLLNNLGELAWSRQDSAEALDLLERAEALSRFVGMDDTLSDGSRIQAEIQLSLGHLDEAEAKVRVAIEAAEGVGSPRLLGPAYRTLARVLHGRIQAGQSDPDLAKGASTAFDSAIAAFEQGDMGNEADATQTLRKKLLSLAS